MTKTANSKKKTAKPGRCAEPGCNHQTAGDYPVCCIHAHTVHYTHRRCLCDQCQPEREAAPIVNPALLAWAINSMLARPLPEKATEGGAAK
jgi:hypothetical protein